MSERTSSAGLRSEGLFDRIRAERIRRTGEATPGRLARLSELLGNRPSTGRSPLPAPVSRRRLKPR